MARERAVVALFVVVIAVALFAACSGGGTNEPTPTSTFFPVLTLFPSSIVGEKTPPPSQGTGSETPAATGDGQTGGGTPVPTAEQGIPVVAPADQISFVARFNGRPIESEPCTYNPSTRVTDCAGTRYAIDPPLRGQDISCERLRIEGEIVAIRCSSQEPLESLYYEVP